MTSRRRPVYIFEDGEENPHPGWDLIKANKKKPPTKKYKKRNGGKSRKLTKPEDRKKNKSIPKSMRWAAALVGAARHRARQKGLAFNLDDHLADIQATLDAGVCQISGIAFKGYGGPRQWNSASLDRAIPKLGYVYGNVRVVIWAVNVAINEWGVDQMIEVAEAIKLRRILRDRYFRRKPASISGKHKGRRLMSKLEDQ